MDIIKQDMTDIWAVAGDVVAPESAKVRAGWAVEAVPRQWWNWFENRQDTNIAYMLQKGIPEWDQFTEYLTNKSYVQRNNIVYKCILTATNQDPATATTYWVKAFPESSIGLETLKGVTPAADTFPYFTGTSTASVTGLSAFMRTVLDDADAATVRTTIGAQQSDATLTALAGLSTATNKLPYFTGTDIAAVTDFTAFARTLLDDSDATTARATLSVYSIADTDSNLAAGLATKQPLATNLTNLAALTISSNTMPYYNGTSTLALTSVTTYGRGFLNLADAAASRSYIGADDASNLTTGTIPLARIPTNLTGVNAATATALQTARTIQGVSFNGTANITLSVVDKDSGVGSATLPAGTTAQRTASPVNGQLRYNSDNNEFEGYINGAWGGIGGGTPLFTVLWWPSRTAIPAGYVAADGQLLTRTTYNAAWPRISAGDVPLVSDATWLATSTSRGAYSSGDGSTTFRIPDLNGKQSGTTAAPFLRGDGTNSTGVAGNFQGSQNLSHSHTVATDAAGTAPAVSASGGTQLNNASRLQYLGNDSSGNYPLYASIQGTNVGGTEARPVNVTGVYIIKLIGGASDLTQEDASVAVAALEQKYLYTGGRNRIINGDCRVAQRGSNGVYPNNVNGYGGPDRFFATNSNAGGQFTQSLGTLVYGASTKNCVTQTVNTVLADNSGSKFWSGIIQQIEGTNCYDLIGNPVTVSFLFKASVAGTYSVSIRDSGSYSYVTTFTVASNVVTRVVVNAPAIPSGASIPNTNALGMTVQIGAQNTSGGTFSTATLNAWQTGVYNTASTMTTWATTSGATISVADLQLEAGTSATEFERRNYAYELTLCQRYYENVSGTVSQGHPRYTNRPYKTVKRASPTVALLAGSLSGASYDGFGGSIEGFRVPAATQSTGETDWTFAISAEL